ncbi:TerC family protein [Candidatus Riesia pediculicola]|uniref:TerC family protein n=1 Tax=Candidatus Riesia pediculicola TaxID=401619 RepID=UPI001FA8B0EC|nr:TerC family protein [Candidatus Riesia pediculicola]
MIEKIIWYLYDPILWIGLLNLIIIEIILGVDNLIFITILSEKLFEKRNQAITIGLISALLIRISLLFSLNYLISLKERNIVLFGFLFSIKDILILFGGLFLIFKSTIELHERLEGKDLQKKNQKYDEGKTAKYWYTVIQIIMLDTIFSVDSIITAIGIIDHIKIVIIAITISTLLMIIASKQLTKLVHNHPTIVILCLSFLLMIGFSLFLEGFGYSIPKGYLYFSVSFSILIEILNHFAILNRRKILKSKKSIRERTAEAILRILEGKHDSIELDKETLDLTHDTKNIFDHQEKQMVVRLLGFSQRSVNSVMTSRHDIKYVSIDQSKEEIVEIIEKYHPNHLIVIDKSVSNEPIGIVYISDILEQQLKKKSFDLNKLITQPIIFPENLSLFQAIKQFQQAKTHFAFVADEFGSVEGIITLIDIIETFSGNLSIDQEEKDSRYDIQRLKNSRWLVNGSIPLEDLILHIPITLDENREYETIAGLLMEKLQRVPSVGERVLIERWIFEPIEVNSRRIKKILITTTL